MTPRIEKVTPLEDYRLLIEYRGGERRMFDARPLMEMEPWSRLKGTKYFGMARPAFGAVEWPGGIDIAPETLYEDSVPA